MFNVVFVGCSGGFRVFCWFCRAFLVVLWDVLGHMQGRKILNKSINDTIMSHTSATPCMTKIQSDMHIGGSIETSPKVHGIHR